MKILIYAFILITSLSSIARENFRDFTLPFNKCVAYSTKVSQYSLIEEIPVESSILVCSLDNHFLTCKDVVSLDMYYLILMSNKDDKELSFFSKSGLKLFLNKDKNSAVFVQNYPDTADYIHSVICKGLFIDKLLDKKPIDLKKGLKNLIEKVKEVSYAK